jgi:hypothetical protein
VTDSQKPAPFEDRKGCGTQSQKQEPEATSRAQQIQQNEFRNKIKTTAKLLAAT